MMKEMVSSLSLKQQAMMLAVTISTLPIVAVGGWSYHFANQALAQQIEITQKKNIADFQASVYTFMKDRIVDIQVIASLDILTNSDLRNQLSAADKTEILNRLQEQYKTYDSMAVFDLGGNLIAQTPGLPLGNHLNRTYIQTALKTNKAVLSQPVVSTSAGTFSIYAASVIRDIKTQQPVGLVRIRMPVTILQSILKRHQDDIANIYLINQNDEVFLKSNSIYPTSVLSSGENQLRSQKLAYSFNINDVFLDLQSNISKQHSVALMMLNSQTKKEQLVVYSPPLKQKDLPDIGWQSVISIDRDIVLAPQRQLSYIFLMGTAVTALFVGLIAGYLANQATQPILLAANTVEQFGRGQLNARVAIAGSREITLLGTNINAMTEKIQQLLTEREETNLTLKTFNNQLKDRTDRLQQEIDERKQVEAALRQSQAQLVQTEKMSSLGQMVAGVAHEINNPVNFIHGNLTHISDYTKNLLRLIHLYQELIPNPPPDIQEEIEAIDLDFMSADLSKILRSMRVGTDRIREIVLSLRNFSRLDEAEVKDVDLHTGIDSTLTILAHRLKTQSERSAIQVIKQYGNLPLVECHAGQINQVFMNILSNAIDALEERNQVFSQDIEANPSQILIRTECLPNDWIEIRIVDNGVGMSAEVLSRLFDPFFTTKPVGKGTGLGLSIAYQIVTEKHKGRLYCHSMPNRGTEFVIEIPCQ